MTRILFRGGRVLDPAANFDATADLLLQQGRVAAVGQNLQADEAKVVDAKGCWLTPGFIDLHAHLREPGQEYKEDLQSGGRAAAAGGFTAVCCMANTNPVNDDPAVTSYIRERARQCSPVRVLPVAAATKGLQGKALSEMSALAEAGAVAFSDDGKTIMDSGVQRRALEYARMVGRALSVHAEDLTLVRDGVINEGATATRMGLPGNPSAAESIHVARDLQLAELTGAHLHVAHVSTAAAVALIREARGRGVHVTAEVTPHHLCLTEAAVEGYETNAKMAPPLRGEADVQACIAGLADGALDAIATDHAPHAVHEKDVEFTAAPPGVLGFETAFPVVLQLVREGKLTPLQLVAALTCKPAQVFGLEGGSLKPGAPADVLLLDPQRRWRYLPAHGYSKSRNSPWAGKEMHGQVLATYVAGKRVYAADEGIIGADAKAVQK